MREQSTITSQSRKRDAEEAHILRERAAALAQAPVPPEAPATRLEFIEFMLNEEQYGVELTYLREVLAVQSMAPLTTAPEFVAGLVNCRGQILTVIDLRPLLGLSQHPVATNPCVLVLEAPGRQFGLLAQALIGIGTVKRPEVQPVPPGTDARAAEYLLGITPEQVALLNGARILGDPKLTVNEEVN